MINCEDFYNHLKENGVDFFCGVPDSLLKDICAYITDHSATEKHVITPNEGNAIALAAGYYLAEKKLPLVYMQNSGFGNTVNPLASLSDKEVYGIPKLLLIGWRGEPGIKDEPQRVKQGRITLELLKTLEVPYTVLSDNWDECQKQVEDAIVHATKSQEPYALVVRKSTFGTYKLVSKPPAVKTTLSREDAVIEVTKQLPKNAMVIATTGKIARELYECSSTSDRQPGKNFLVIGSMGHASHIALGINLSKPEVPVFCFDGDGAALMHLGGIAMAGQRGSTNYKHVIFNNGAHESVGGQPTIAQQISFPEIAKACGYKSTIQVSSLIELKSALPKFINSDGPSLLEVMVTLGARKDLGRPKETPKENRDQFMKNF